VREADRRHGRGDGFEVQQQDSGRHEDAGNPRRPRRPAPPIAAQRALADLVAPPEDRGLLDSLPPRQTARPRAIDPACVRRG
jgi:hypothetical protein